MNYGFLTVSTNIIINKLLIDPLNKEEHLVFTVSTLVNCRDQHTDTKQITKWQMVGEINHFTRDLI